MSGVYGQIGFDDICSLVQCCSAGKRPLIELQESSVDTVMPMLDYIYGKGTFRLTLAQAVSLFRMSDKYGVVQLRKQCARILVIMLNSSILAPMQELAERHSCSELLQVCQSISEAPDSQFQ